MVDDAREVTIEQANAYQAAGKKPKKPKAGSKAKVKLAVTANNTVTKESEKRIYIRIQHTADEDKLMALKELMDTKTGATSVVLVVGAEESKKVIKLPNSVEPNEQFLTDLAEIFGKPAVKYQ